MEVLLQHFRDSRRHSADPLAQQASKQLTDWLAAKDQQMHCCGTCCVGFESKIELLVHLKHAAVHKGTPEAEQAAAMLLPKDEARFLRRDLQGSPMSTNPMAQHLDSSAYAESPEAPPAAPEASQAASEASQTLASAQKLNKAASSMARLALSDAAISRLAASLPAALQDRLVATAKRVFAATGHVPKHASLIPAIQQVADDVPMAVREQIVSGARKIFSEWAAEGGNASQQGTTGGTSTAAQLAELVNRGPSVESAPSGQQASLQTSLPQPEFVQSLQRRTVHKKRKQGHGVSQSEAACSVDEDVKPTHMTIIEGQPAGTDATPPPAKKAKK